MDDLVCACGSKTKLNYFFDLDKLSGLGDHDGGKINKQINKSLRVLKK